MDKLDLNGILSLNENDSNDFQKCYNYLKKYIEDIKENKFEKDYVIDLKALIDKFLQFAIPFELNNQVIIQDLLNFADKLEQSCYKNTFEETKSESEITMNLIYQHLYSNFIKVYNKINLKFRNSKEELLDFDGILNYEISNKRKAINIIQDALDLIETDNTLSKKSKKKIIDYLSDAIQELNNPKTNWTNYFKKTAEVIIVLGALGSITGGIDASNNLINAKEKIEEAQYVIVNTSINLNYLNIENTFNISKPIEIENNRILMIEENNKQLHTTKNIVHLADSANNEDDSNK